MAASALQTLQGGLATGGGFQGTSPALQGGGINLQGSSPNLQPTASPINAAFRPAAPASKAVAPAPATGSGVSSSSGINSPGYLQGLQNEYGSVIANAQRQIPFYQNYMNTLQGAAVNQAGQQTADENNTFTAANNAYNTQNQATQNQAKLSLAELADQIHGQNQGLINQLGTLGAGSSSALGTGQTALAKVQNTNRADIQQQAGANTAEISAAQQSLLQQHQSNLDQIAQYKTNTLNNIIGYYTPMIQNAQTAMHQAQGEEQRLAAMYNLNALTQQAGGALQNLDNTVGALTQKSLSQLSAPESLSPINVKAAPTAVAAPSVSPFNVGNTGAANTTAAPTGGSLAALAGQLKQQ